MLTAILRRSAQFMILAGLYLSIFDSAQAQNGPRAATLQTVNGQYVVAVGGGGGAVNATASIVGVGTTFTLIDLNGGTLRSGDKVQFRTERGTYLVAEGGGGREVKADRTIPSDWETFTIWEVGGSIFSQTIGYNDPFTLQAHNGQYVVAESGGGAAVNASRSVADAWETFRFQGPPIDVTNCPICSNQLDWYEKGWQESRLYSHDVAALDPVGHQVGKQGLTPAALKRSELSSNPLSGDFWRGVRGQNWYLLSWEKRTVCGVVDEATVHPAVGRDDHHEKDINIDLIPDDHYTWAITDAWCCATLDHARKDWLLCDPNRSGKRCTCDPSRSEEGEGEGCLSEPDKDPRLLGRQVNDTFRRYAIATEVTPTEEMWNNPWFKIVSVKKPGPFGTTLSSESLESSFNGKRLCTYGPFIREENHGNKSEIHPAEMYWWREDLSPSKKRYMLMQIQDDSERFSKWGHFSKVNSDADGDGVWQRNPEYTDWWRPWAAPPMVGQFRIAFESDLDLPDGQLPVYTIVERDPKLPLAHFPSQNMSPHTDDSGPGRDHAITYTVTNKVGVPLRKITALTVRERVRYPEKLGIRIQEICRDPVTNRIRGFISITSAVGRDDDGKEGFMIMQVDQTTVGDP